MKLTIDKNFKQGKIKIINIIVMGSIISILANTLVVVAFAVMILAAIGGFCKNIDANKAS